MPEKIPWWADPLWWRKNWWTVIVALGMILGVILTFVGHTSSIVDLREDIVSVEEEIDSLKSLIVDMREDNMESYTKIGILSSDVGRIRESINRIENILMDGE